MAKTGLGRGLDAILPKTALDGATGDAVREVRLDRLEPSRFQPRTAFDDADLDELAASIAAQGIIQPLVVAPAGADRFTIVAGERRWRAASIAGLETVPVVVRHVTEDRELLELALVENLQRSDLNAMEEAEAFESLRRTFALSQAEIGSRVGRSRSAVTNSLRLLRLAPPVQDFLRDGRLTAGQARPLLALPSNAEQVALAERAVNGSLSARRIEALVGGKESSPKPRVTIEHDVHTAAAAEKLTRALQAKVEIARRGRRGTVRISFQSEDELIHIFDTLMAKGDRL